METKKSMSKLVDQQEHQQHRGMPSSEWTLKLFLQGKFRVLTKIEFNRNSPWSQMILGEESRPSKLDFIDSQTQLNSASSCRGAASQDVFIKNRFYLDLFQ